MNLDQILIFKLFDLSESVSKIVQNHTLERDETKINSYTVYLDQEDKAGGMGNKNLDVEWESMNVCCIVNQLIICFSEMGWQTKSPLRCLKSRSSML